MTRDLDTTTTAPGFWALYLRGFNFSIFTLWGLVLGAGLSVPIVLEQYHAWWSEDLTLSSMAGLGAYLLVVAFLGTWLSLGLLGEWAGRKGGRMLRLLVQISGILLAACLTLFCAFPVVFVAMVWSGSRRKRDDVWLWYLAILVLAGFVYVSAVRPGLNAERVRRLRAERGDLVQHVVSTKEREYDNELRRQNGYLIEGGSRDDWNCEYDLWWSEERRTVAQPTRALRVTISCSDDGVITVISRGGQKEDDFLKALETAVRERGWNVEVIRKAKPIH